MGYAIRRGVLAGRDSRVVVLVGWERMSEGVGVGAPYCEFIISLMQSVWDCVVGHVMCLLFVCKVGVAVVEAGKAVLRGGFGGRLGA